MDLIQTLTQTYHRQDCSFEAYQPLLDSLTSQSQTLAQSLQARQTLAVEQLISVVHQLWTDYHHHYQRKKPISHEIQAPPSQLNRLQTDAIYRGIQLLTVAVRCLRNGMVGVSQSQQTVYQHLDQIKPLVSYCTSFTALTDPDVIPLARTVAQMLSNLVTCNPILQNQFWTQFVVTTHSDQQLIPRLLSSPDTATLTATQVLLINLIKSQSDQEAEHLRCIQLSTTMAGLAVIESLLMNAESVILGSGDDDHNQAEDLEESLGLIYILITHLFQQGLAATLLQQLAPIGSNVNVHQDIDQDKQIMSNSQLILLKLLDSWLHYNQKAVADGPDDNNTIPLLLDHADRPLAGLQQLVDMFYQFSRFARDAMKRGMKVIDDVDNKPQDKRLIGVHHGLLLLLECFLSIGLIADGWSVSSSSSPTTTTSTLIQLPDLCRLYVSWLRDNTEWIDELVDLLDQTHLYAPPLSPFPSSSSTAPPPPPDHVLSSTGAAAKQQQQQQPSYGFDHLKRNLVRVLGVLVFSPSSNSTLTRSFNDQKITTSQIQNVQDRVRQKGGLYHILNMTVLDDRNPYMREHAIFTLRYMLANNIESQEFISKLQPV